MEKGRWKFLMINSLWVKMLIEKGLFNFYVEISI